MKIDIELFTWLQHTRPLSMHWLKKDYITFLEALFIYYGIEPMKWEEMMGPTPEMFIEKIDKDQVWDVMQGSDINFFNGRGIRFEDFVDFLNKKKFPIPSCLQVQQKVENLNASAKSISMEEVLNFDYYRARPEQLQRLIAQAYSVLFWKAAEKSGSIVTSANELITKKDFIQLLTLIGAGNIESKTQAEWISRFSPRARKQRKEKK